jgi:hypothetical protein
MGIELSGFDELSRHLEQLAKAAEMLHGDIAQIHFDPNDPDSGQRAVTDMRAAVDAKAGEPGRSPFAKEIIEAVKDHFETAIRQHDGKAEGV